MNKKILVHLAILVTFIVLYKLSFEDNFTKNKIDKEPGWTDAVYFGVSCHTTVGFGDVTPTTVFGKLLTTSHMLLVLFVTLWML